MAAVKKKKKKTNRGAIAKYLLHKHSPSKHSYLFVYPRLIYKIVALPGSTSPISAGTGTIKYWSTSNPWHET